MGKNNNGIPDWVDAIIRYAAGYTLLGYIGFNITDLSQGVVITLAVLATILIGEEKALNVLDRGGV